MTVGVATTHKKKDCLHPRFHSDSPNFKSMDFLRGWLAKNGRRHHAYPEKPLMRVAQLCEFGGVAWKDDFGWAEDEEADSTWVVCPRCHAVAMCGYGDDGSIGPDACKKCKIVFSISDYFQDIYRKYKICDREQFCTKHETIHSPEVKREIRRNIMAFVRNNGDVPHTPNNHPIFAALRRAIPEIASRYAGERFEDEVKTILLRMFEGNDGLIKLTPDYHLQISEYALKNNIEF